MGNFFHGATITIRTKAFQAIGGMDISLVRAQDYDAWIRLLLEGFRPAALDVWVALHRLHGGLRGTASVPVPASSVVQRTFVDEQSIFRKLYPCLGLQVLVPELHYSDDQALKLEALLLRAVAMAKRGLVQEASHDLREVAHLVRQDAYLTSRSSRLLSHLESLLNTWLNSANSGNPA